VKKRNNEKMTTDMFIRNGNSEVSP